MKKILVLLLVLSVILGTAACGAASKEPEATPVPATEAPVPAEAAPAPEATPEPVPETTPEPTPEATPEPTPTPSPAALLGPVISVSGERYPETLTAGKKFGIKGIVSASSGVLTEVYAKVTDSNGKIAISSQIYRPNKPTLDIHETINNDLSFGQLGAGTYTYTVTATADDSGRKTTTDIIVRQFTVKEYAAAPIADQATDKALYKSVLDAYSRAFSEGWDRQTLEDNGLNSFYGLSDAGSRLNEIGYAFLDLDSNGTDELILGYVADGPGHKRAECPCPEGLGEKPLLARQNGSHIQQRLRRSCLYAHFGLVLLDLRARLPAPEGLPLLRRRFKRRVLLAVLQPLCRAVHGSEDLLGIYYRGQSRGAHGHLGSGHGRYKLHSLFSV